MTTPQGRGLPPSPDPCVGRPLDAADEPPPETNSPSPLAVFMDSDVGDAILLVLGLALVFLVLRGV